MTQQKPGNDYDQLAEFFSDTFEVHTSQWSSSLTFGIRPAREGESNLFVVRVRMPVVQLKTLGIIALRTIRELESKGGVIVDLPTETLNALGIPPEDWK